MNNRCVAKSKGRHLETMQITVNGQCRSIADGFTVADLLKELAVAVPHVAVEVNRDLVPRARHAQTVLKSGDALEVVTLVGGG